MQAELIKLIGIKHEPGGTDCLWACRQALAILGFGSVTVDDMRQWTQVGTEAHHAREIGDIVHAEYGGEQSVAVCVQKSPQLLLTSFPKGGTRFCSPRVLQEVVGSVKGVYRRP